MEPLKLFGGLVQITRNKEETETGPYLLIDIPLTDYIWEAISAVNVSHDQKPDMKTVLVEKTSPKRIIDTTLLMETKLNDKKCFYICKSNNI
jgi:hypothetical protein